MVDAEGAEEEGQDGCDQPFFVDLMAQFRRNGGKGPVRIGVEAVRRLLFPAGEGAFQRRLAAARRAALFVIDAVRFEVVGHDGCFAVDVRQFRVEDLRELFFVGFIELTEELFEPLLGSRHFFRLQSRRRQFLVFPDHVDGPVLIVVDEMGRNGDAVRILLQIVEEVAGHMLHVGDGLEEVRIRQAAPFPFHGIEITQGLGKIGLVLRRYAALPLPIAQFQSKRTRFLFLPPKNI